MEDGARFDVEETPVKRVKLGFNLSQTPIAKLPVVPVQPQEDFLSSVFTGSYEYSELLRTLEKLGQKILEEEDTVDELTPKWQFVAKCFGATPSPSVPKELKVFQFLVVMMINDNITQSIKADYLSQPGSNAKFFEDYMELLNFCYTDYIYGDPKNASKWMVTYQTLQKAWTTKTIPPAAEIPSVCTLSEKKVRAPPNPNKKKKAAPKKAHARKRRIPIVI